MKTYEKFSKEWRKIGKTVLKSHLCVSRRSVKSLSEGFKKKLARNSAENHHISYFENDFRSNSLSFFLWLPFIKIHAARFHQLSVLALGAVSSRGSFLSTRKDEWKKLDLLLPLNITVDPELVSLTIFQRDGMGYFCELNKLASFVRPTTSLNTRFSFLSSRSLSAEFFELLGLLPTPSNWTWKILIGHSTLKKAVFCGWFLTF